MRLAQAHVEQRDRRQTGARASTHVCENPLLRRFCPLLRLEMADGARPAAPEALSELSLRQVLESGMDLVADFSDAQKTMFALFSPI